MNPRVTIIITAYNARRWLGEAIDSALAQTYPSCEVLIVDDGSTDGTGQWVTSQYGRRVRCLRKENGGLASARNLGLSQARGHYIQFLDADDLILPEKVALHAAYLDAHPETGVVYSHCLLLSSDAPQEAYDWHRYQRYRSGQIFASMVDDGGYLLTHMLLSRRTCLEEAGGFDESLASCVDWDFWLRVAWSGATFAYLNGPALALYRIRPDSLSANRASHARNGLRVLTKVAGYVKDPQQRHRLGLKRAFGHWRFRYGHALAESGRRSRGLWEMARGVCADPRDLDYKLGVMTLCLLGDPHRALNRVRRLKARKDALRRWVSRSQPASDG